MEINLILKEFESGFGSSFMHTSRVNYDVDFNNSNIWDVKEKLEILHARVESGKSNNKHVGWPMDIKHLELLQNCLEKIIDKYKSIFSVEPPRDMKFRDIDRILRYITLKESNEKPALEDVSQTYSSVSKKQSSKDELEQYAVIFSKVRNLKALRQSKGKK